MIGSGSRLQGMGGAPCFPLSSFSRVLEPILAWPWARVRSKECGGLSSPPKRPLANFRAYEGCQNFPAPALTGVLPNMAMPAIFLKLNSDMYMRKYCLSVGEKDGNNVLYSFPKDLNGLLISLSIFTIIPRPTHTCGHSLWSILVPLCKL